MEHFDDEKLKNVVKLALYKIDDIKEFVMEKRLAVQFFGHLRTFRKTFESFQKNVVEANRADGYEIDIFMHTWDELEIIKANWTNTNNDIRGKKVSECDLEFVKSHYKPTAFSIEKMTVEHGLKLSMETVDNLRRKYENAAEGIKVYDWIIMTRPDILFNKPFRIAPYIDIYSETGALAGLGIPDDVILTAHNSFTWLDVADPRYVCESDLIWFAKPNAILNRFDNCISGVFGKNKMILLNYILFRDYHIIRSEERPKRRQWLRLLTHLLACLIPSRRLRRKIRGGE